MKRDAAFTFFTAFCVALSVWGCSSTPSPQPTNDTADDTTVTDGCTGTEGAKSWQVLTYCRDKGELLSVWGTGPKDVWTVGAGGQALHFDGCQWKTLDTGTQQDLWWVRGFKDGPVFMVGADGTALKYTPESGFEAMETGVKITLYGIWGPAPDDLWTIGFMPDQSLASAILHYDGAAWTKVENLPAEVTDKSQFFKVWGTATDDVWVVGRGDIILHWDGTTWTNEKSGLDEDWVTVTGRIKPDGKQDIIVVGGRNAGTILQRTTDGWASIGPEGYAQLQGVCVQPDGSALATGVGATILSRSPGLSWTEALDAPFDLFNPLDPPVPGCMQPTPDYHACFADGEGGFFLVGGNFFAFLTEGVILHYGYNVPTTGL
jgi:hypothetical protein